MIEYRKCSIRFSDSFSLQSLNWRIAPGDTWAIVGPNGSGKSALAASLLSQGKVLSGHRQLAPEQTAILSLEEQGRLIEREKIRDDSDITDKVNPGTPVREMLDEVCIDRSLQDRLVHVLGLESLLERGFRKLSTGETRKVLFIRTLASSPSVIVLDEPFEGLDAQTVARVRDILSEMAGHASMVLAVNRFDDIPDFITHILRLDAGAISEQFACQDSDEARRVLSQISQIRSGHSQLPEPEEQMALSLNEDGSLVRLRQGRVAYTDNLVFENLNWQIYPGEHWRVKGPNGSGKTCLLNLVTGDHPQCYINDLSLFGFKRGEGETIWDIKRYIGYVSTALHWDYRLSVSVAKVILSGFYDSIGLYSKANAKQMAIAEQWLLLLGLNDKAGDSFASLSYGEQRILLIARAMVKHPALLLLDEPCMGLDEANRALVLSLIDRICEAGPTTLVYVSHHEEDKIAAIERELDLSQEN